MSKRFSMLSFVAKFILQSSEAFIASTWDKEGEEYSSPQEYYNDLSNASDEHYALLEDLKGAHYPIPKAPQYIQRIFMEMQKRRKIRRVRGVNFFFYCPLCGERSFYTFRNSRCRGCNCDFDEQIQVSVADLELLFDYEEIVPDVCCVCDKKIDYTRMSNNDRYNKKYLHNVIGICYECATKGHTKKSDIEGNKYIPKSSTSNS